MARLLFVCALLCVWPICSPGQDSAGDTETIVRLTVQPMAAPVPALKYQLLPELREMNPGNPIQGYLKCFMEQRHFFFDQAMMQKREKWLTMPLHELPLQELQDYGGTALRQADYAARLDAPDWQILLLAKRDGAHFILSDVQQLRMLVEPLKVRFRARVAEQRFDEALTTAKTMFALARHIGEHPTVIADLVGIACAAHAFNCLEEMIAEPGCPNLYWALTDLPSPLVDMHKGVQGERLMGEVEFAFLDSSAPMSAAQLEKAVSREDETLQFLEGNRRFKDWVQAHVSNETAVREARQRLIEYGLSAEKVKDFPPLQVILLDEKREFEVRRDDALKWVALPYPQVEAGLSALPPPDDKSPHWKMLVSYLKIRKAQARLDRRIALLRCMEALRLYAAANDGKLPARLDDLSVPVPADPFTGKPFGYETKGQIAILRAPPPRGEENIKPYNLRYEVTIKK